MKFVQAIPEPKYKGSILQLEKYTTALAPTPPKVFWEYVVPSWGMLGNDSAGDCEIARMGHVLMETTAHTGKMVTPTLEQVMAAYSAISGYDPSQTQPDGSNPTDVGCNTQDVMEYWRTVGIAGHKIAAWVQVASTQAAIEQAIWLFGAAAIDIAVYQSMMDQTSNKQPWDNPTGDLLGLHAVPGMGFGAEGLTVVTWGALQQMGWPTCLKILQGVFAAITPDWIEANGKAPNGFDLATLVGDLQQVGT